MTKAKAPAATGEQQLIDTKPASLGDVPGHGARDAFGNPLHTPLATRRTSAVEAAERQVGTLLELAIKQGDKFSVEALERLVALHERVSATRAASEFADAMAAFQEECPPIAKKSRTRYTTKAGIQVKYTYAELDEIARTIGPLLHPRGLSYSWDSSVDGSLMTCVCTVRHVNGHSQTASFASPVDTEAKMSGPQRHAAALTYARRQSLVQALGLTTADPDTDAIPTETISEHQATNLESLLADSGANRQRFLDYLGVEEIADIRECDFQAAVAALEAKRRQSP